MRRAAALLLLAVLLPLPSAAQASGDLRITELLPQPDAARGQREFIELTNIGTAPLDLTGWRVRDAPTASNATNAFTFSSGLLEPGRRIVLWSNGSADGLTFSQSAAKSVWNDGGDSATLLDPGGAIRDWIGYGSAAQATGFPAKSPAPARGASLQLGNGTWQAGEPNPGLAPGEQGGRIQGEVANVAPALVFQAPVSAAPRSTLSAFLQTTDPNGAPDVKQWSIASAGTIIARGNGSHDGNLSLATPGEVGDWSLTAQVVDQAGLHTTLNVTVRITAPRLAVHLPASGSLRFPLLRPGDADVTSLEAFTVRNDGEHKATPLLDISDFRSGQGRINVTNNLWLGVTQASQTSWHRYAGPLQALPELAPGATASIVLRIGAIPIPTPAGTYGTTFTVVPA